MDNSRVTGAVFDPLGSRQDLDQTVLQIQIRKAGVCLWSLPFQTSTVAVWVLHVPATVLNGRQAPAWRPLLRWVVVQFLVHLDHRRAEARAREEALGGRISLGGR